MAWPWPAADVDPWRRRENLQKVPMSLIDRLPHSSAGAACHLGGRVGTESHRLSGQAIAELIPLVGILCMDLRIANGLDA